MHSPLPPGAAVDAVLAEPPGAVSASAGAAIALAAAAGSWDSDDDSDDDRMDGGAPRGRRRSGRSDDGAGLGDELGRGGRDGGRAPRVAGASGADESAEGEGTALLEV